MQAVSGLAIAALVVSPVVGCASKPPVVEQHGRMRTVLREGRTEGRITVTDAAARPGAIAVGALEGLQGEITILDGAVWVARPGEDDLAVTGPDPVGEDRATLLTLASVRRWRSVPLELDGRTGGLRLEDMIARTAREHGVDTASPFPFVIEGVVSRIDVHVINGFCPMSTDPATVDAEPWKWSSDRPVEATIVGFHAPDAAGNMTHHGTKIHVHAIFTIDGRTATGHVDRLVVAPGATLRLPAGI